MILTPGPVEVSTEVLSASQKHMPHRSEEFREILRKSLLRIDSARRSPNSP